MVEKNDEGIGVRLKELVSQIGVPRLIIFGFLALLFVTAIIKGLPIGQLLSSSIIRFGMNGILVLAMIPSIQSGTGPNFALPLGICFGLVAVIVSVELNMVGFVGFLFSVVLAALLGGVSGYVYGIFQNRVKGQEMTVGTYFGFAIVSLMCIFWTLAPFKSPEMIWPYGGSGLRNTIMLEKRFGGILDNFLSFKIFDVTFPTGLILFFALFCFLMWIFTRSRAGIAMSIVGSNPRFAESAGLNVDKYRLLGSILSQALGAIGMVIYAESYGFLQLYMAPLFMAFFAVASILIGGASLKRATVWHVLIGTFLFQFLLTISMPVANVMVADNLAEVIRIIISNGMILYALTRKEAGVDVR